MLILSLTLNFFSSHYLRSGRELASSSGNSLNQLYSPSSIFPFLSHFEWRQLKLLQRGLSRLVCVWLWKYRLRTCNCSCYWAISAGCFSQGIDGWMPNVLVFYSSSLQLAPQSVLSVPFIPSLRPLLSLLSSHFIRLQPIRHLSCSLSHSPLFFSFSEGDFLWERWKRVEGGKWTRELLFLFICLFEYWIFLSIRC